MKLESNVIYKSIGILKYSNAPYKLALDCDQELSNFYRSLIPFWFNIKRPMWGAHISIVRNIIPINLQFWNKYQDTEIEFEYEPIIYNDETYYWLNCYSPKLEEIRVELGMKPYGDVTVSPGGLHKFHMTIGNLKK